MVEQFDNTIISWFQKFTGSWMLDYSIYCISDNDLFKGILFLTVIWWFWFRRGKDPVRDRTLVVGTLCAALLAIALNKTAQMIAPVRMRPYGANTGFDFPFDFGTPKHSSFPSDHASLFFALATGVFFLSRRMGIAAWLYAVVVICVPRIYLGLHYPSDVTVGAIIGIFSASLMNGTGLCKLAARPVLALEEKHPGLFYAGAFLFTYQLADLFDNVRALFPFFNTLMGR